MMHDEDDDSDFDDDEDPDKIEVPGGGRDLAKAANLIYDENLIKKENVFNSSDDVNVANQYFQRRKLINTINRNADSTSIITQKKSNDYLRKEHLYFKNVGKTVDQLREVENTTNLVINLDHQIIDKVSNTEEEDENEELGVAETYADYMPMKLKYGLKHPDPVVESASLSSVEPADVSYQISIPEKIIASGALSALQLESITYASQQHQYFLPDGSRAGFLIGDGAGVGKGRTIAGIILENYLKGRKRAVWISISNDLKYDAERDLLDIGAHKIKVNALNKIKYGKISSNENKNIKKGVIFSTYSALIGESPQRKDKYKSRLKQLIHWCGDDFDGVIIFDECHKAKNLYPSGTAKPTKTGLAVLELQNKLPKARVVYASATGATEPKNMAYMVRLGLWGKGTIFTNFSDFLMSVEKRGVGAMELVAMDMKLRGMYIARQLSFHGVTFRIEEVPLTKEFEEIYDESVRLWVEVMYKFKEASNLIEAESSMKKAMWSQFWSSHQRFFKYLCIAAKVKHTVRIAREAVKCGKCVVIGLQSTGEARTLEQLERDDGEIHDFVSTAKGVLQSLVEKHFPAPNKNHIDRVLGYFDMNQSNEIKDDMKTINALKRKEVQQVFQEKSKKVCTKQIGIENLERQDSKHLMDLKFEIQHTDSEDEILSDDELSNNSSNYNPFDSDSNSEVDPWERRNKKETKESEKKFIYCAKEMQSILTNHALSRSTEAFSCTKNYSEDQMAITKEDVSFRTLQQIAIEQACNMKDELLIKIENLGKKLPSNTLDQLIDELGGPENVAEMTGRKGRIVQMEDGSIQYELRSEADIPLETVNLIEKQRFMDGDKTVAIISEAASSGISLQSDRRARNQMRRVHITLELPWSADRAIQQFGRTHRSNQVNAPEYIFLISNLAGERRFASILAKRLESLGALTHGDRRATETRDFSQFNFDNKYGRIALETILKTILGHELPLVLPPQEYAGDFFQDMTKALVGVGLLYSTDNTPETLLLDKDYNNIPKFLNRILGITVNLQNLIFKYFTDTFTAIIAQARKNDHFDMGILDVGISGENVCHKQSLRFLRKHTTGIAATELHIVQVERGLSWYDALKQSATLLNSYEGFYLSHQIRNEKQTAILAKSADMKSEKKMESEDQLYIIYRPNTGQQLRQEPYSELKKKYKKVTAEDAKFHWIQQYESSLHTCSHAYWNGNCKNVSLRGDCEVGLRRKTYNILSGSVLSVWNHIETILASRTGYNSKMQVVRLRTNENLKIVGTIIPRTCMDAIKKVLSVGAEKIEARTY